MSSDEIVYSIGLTSEGVLKWLEVGDKVTKLLYKIDDMKKNGKTSSVIDFSDIELPLHAVAGISNRMLYEISNDDQAEGENNG